MTLCNKCYLPQSSGGDTCWSNRWRL